MRTPKFVKALLLTSALFAALAPAYASARPVEVALSNTITASFKVTAPAPSLVLKWTDSAGTADNGTELQQMTVISGDVKDLYIKAKANGQNYDYGFMLSVTHPDNAALSKDDFEIIEEDSTEPLTETQFDDGWYVVSARGYSLLNGQDQVHHFKIKFNTTGTYKIDAAATELPG